MVSSTAPRSSSSSTSTVSLTRLPSRASEVERIGRAYSTGRRQWHPPPLLGGGAPKLVQPGAARCPDDTVLAAASADGRCPRCPARLDRRKADPAKEPSGDDAGQDGLDLATRILSPHDDRDHNRASAGSRQRRSGRPMPRAPGLIAAHGRGDANTGEDVSRQTLLRGHTSEHDDDHATEPEPDRLPHAARLQRCASVRIFPRSQPSTHPLRPQPRRERENEIQ